MDMFDLLEYVFGFQVFVCLLHFVFFLKYVAMHV